MSSRYQSKVHQREGRTALFDTTGEEPPKLPADDDYERSSSPYTKEPKRDMNAAILSQLESQNEDTVNTMSSKIAALKGLSVKMGDQIRQSNLDLGELGSDFTVTSARIKNIVKQMTIMAEKTGIPLKVWLIFFVIVFLLFFWVWI